VRIFSSSLAASLIYVFAQTGLLQNSGILWAVLSICAILAVLLTGRKIMISFLKTKAVYTPDCILGKRKPYYLDKSGWDIILEDARMHKINQGEFTEYINLLKPYYYSDRKIDY
jgi:hypothetical protein